MSSRLTATAGGGNSGDVGGIAALFLRLGCTSFGGPAAHVALMEAEVVTGRAWLTRAEFLDLQGVVQVLPGPNSTELAIHIGQHRGGWRGGIAAGLSFVLPGVLLVWLLASVAATPALRPVTASVLWWLAPVVVAVLTDALWKFGSQAWQRPFAMVLLPITALTAALVQSDVLVLLIGALVSIALQSGRMRDAGAMAGALLAIVVGGALLAQSAVSASVLHSAPGTGAIFLYFLRAGATVFGSGYVLLAYLQRDLVDARHWLSIEALTQASALAQITPGPLFATATASGYVIGGNAGAAVATVGIFLPAFLSVTVSGPIRRLIRHVPLVRAALDGVVIASVALLGRALVGFAFPLSRAQWLAGLIAMLAMFAGRVQATLLLVGAVLAGIVASLLHSPLS